MKYIITVKTLEQKFTTYEYEINNGRLTFEDKFGNKKNFPEDSCFIEEVRE